MNEPAADASEREMPSVSENSLWQTHRMVAVGRLSRVTTHEFNNLMQGVVASLELTRKLIVGGRAGEAAPLIAKAITSAQKAALLNQRVARFARPQPVAAKVVSLNTVVGDIEEMLRFSLAPAIKLDVALAEDLWPVHCDAGQASVAVVDMVLHARDSLPGGGTIGIATGNETPASNGRAPHARSGAHVHDGVCVAVTAVTGASHAPSSGPGPMAAMSRANPPSEALTMVDRFAHMYGGELRLRDDASETTATELYLPRFVVG